jgi:HD-like signal output (HDOD) protein
MREDAEHFIQHAVYTAVISTVMEVSGSQAANDAFVTGLLHNMGTLIMVHLDREKYAKLKAENPAENTARCMMEQVAYGFNHAELAAECLDRWGLPGRVVHAIRHHHVPVTRQLPYSRSRTMRQINFLKATDSATSSKRPSTQSQTVCSALVKRSSTPDFARFQAL